MKVFDLIEPVLKKLDFGADFTLYGNLFVNLLVLMVLIAFSMALFDVVA